MAEHNETGKQGEELAARFLVKHGFIILERNWKYKHLEIDIIAAKDDLILSVEVKTRRTDFVENLNEIVSRKKQLFLIEATDAYIEKKDINKEVRFDIVFIKIVSNKYYLKHIPDAFSAIG